MACDLCGREEAPFQVRIESTVMSVCRSCKEYGEVVRQPRSAARAVQRAYGARGRRESMLLVIADYATRIKRERERLGLTQEELAKRLRIKESQLHKFESGIHKPDLETARQLERALRTQLVEEHVEEHAGSQASAGGPMTIGDLLKR